MARVSVRLDELMDRPEPLYDIDMFFDEETDRIAMARFKVIIQMDLLNSYHISYPTPHLDLLNSYYICVPYV
jgi:hypothetical protein